MSTKQQVIEETSKLFLEHGIKSVRMDDIAVRLGISKRTLYEMFGDRENLITCCAKHYHDVQDAKATEMISKTSNIIEQFFLLLDFWEENEPKVNFMNDLQRFYPAIFEKVKNCHREEGIEMLKAKLKQGVKEGFFQKNINYDFAAYVLVESINNILMRPSSYQSSNISVTQAFKYIVMCFFRGIATQEGIRQIDKLMLERNKNKIREKTQSKVRHL